MWMGRLCDCEPPDPHSAPTGFHGRVTSSWSGLGECQGSAGRCAQEHGRPTLAASGLSGALSGTEDSGAEEFLWRMKGHVSSGL